MGMPYKPGYNRTAPGPNLNLPEAERRADVARFVQGRAAGLIPPVVL